ncbi:MAG: hypothetical protein A3F91_15230 [Flavobacteria bacterium RIFCSPLOWO2_12_FULL_35_11]|nr:MAG: hypothetical protein A3F91_15230 [Flavobacteria bacterium RIFCSPLOWO2_12_FULL_35_11]
MDNIIAGINPFLGRRIPTTQEDNHNHILEAWELFPIHEGRREMIGRLVKYTDNSYGIFPRVEGYGIMKFRLCKDDVKIVN